jgi:hypothetical protein
MSQESSNGPWVEIYLGLPAFGEMPGDAITRIERVIESQEFLDWMTFKTGVTITRAGWLRDYLSLTNPAYLAAMADLPAAPDYLQAYAAQHQIKQRMIEQGHTPLDRVFAYGSQSALLQCSVCSCGVIIQWSLDGTTRIFDGSALHQRCIQETR